MSSDSLADPGRDFLTIALDLELLTTDTAREVSIESSTRNLSAGQLVLQKGLLSAVEVDIVETLTRPLETIPGYEILEPIGKGGMGVVYRAKQLNLNRTVALKTILVGQMADATALARFEQEAVAVGQLTHPNIVGAYDFGRHEGRVYFAMELVEGDDAGRLIDQSGRLTEAVAWGLARQAAAGLAHAARLGIVHRDIKPENLLLVEPPAGFLLPAGLPMVKVADFGLAFLTGDVETRTRITSTNAAVGSPHYMSPEQLGDESIDLRADMYSLGASVYHMLAGKPPFGGKSLPQIVTAKLAERVPSLESAQVSRLSDRLVQRLMQRDPGARFDNYELLLAEIDKVIGVLRGGAGDSAANLAAGSETQEFRTSEVGEDQKLGTTAKLTTTAKMPKQTTATKIPVQKAQRRYRSAFVGVLLLVVLATCGFFVARSFFPAEKPYEPSKPSLVLSQRTQQFYNGENLQGLVTSGPWTTKADGRGSRALSGEDGSLSKALPDWPNYRLTVFTWLHGKATAEIHFAVVANGSDPARRLVVRLTADGVQVGKKPSQRGLFEPLTKLVPLEKTDDYSVIQIDKQNRDWFVWFDGRPIAAMPLNPTQTDQFRLVASGGEVWFHELAVQELVEPSVASP